LVAAGVTDLRGYRDRRPYGVPVGPPNEA
jgi:hypothetical protein